MKIADIPSDAKSVDGLVDSDNDVNENEENCSGGGVWVKDGKQRANSPFIADFGPNIPDTLQIQVCYFNSRKMCNFQ